MADVRMIRCSSCGTVNRVPEDKLAQGLRPVCGHCKAPLVLDGAPIDVTDATFAAEVEQSRLPVLVDLWAPWCGPCRMVGPVVEQIAAEYAGRLRVAKLNVDENPLTATRFNAMSIPLLLVIDGGREVERIIGARPKREIVQHLERWVNR
jgi:thioredoxin 2